MTEILNILIVVKVIQRYTFVKTHQMTQLKRVNFTLAKLCFNKPDFLKQMYTKQNMRLTTKMHWVSSMSMRRTRVFLPQSFRPSVTYACACVSACPCMSVCDRQHVYCFYELKSLVSVCDCLLSGVFK